MTATDRARSYLAACPGAGAGDRDNTAIATACKLVERFDLPEADLADLLLEWNTAANTPPLTEREVRKCLRSALERAVYDPAKANGAGKPAARRTDRKPARPPQEEPAQPLPDDETWQQLRSQLTDGTGEAAQQAREYLLQLGIDPAACGWGLGKLTAAQAAAHGLPQAAAGVRYLLPVCDPVTGALADVRRYAGGPFARTDIAEHHKLLPWAKGTGRAKPYRFGPETAGAAVVWTEGEKDCEAARAHGIPAVSNTCGAGSAHRVAEALPAEALPAEVTTLFDADEAGDKGAAGLAEALAARGVPVKVATWPADAPAGYDVADALRDGWTADDLRALLEAATPYTPPAPDPTAAERVAELVDTVTAAEPGDRPQLVTAALAGGIAEAVAELRDTDPAAAEAAHQQLKAAMPRGGKERVDGLWTAAKECQKQSRQSTRLAERADIGDRATEAMQDWLAERFVPLYRVLDPPGLALWDRHRRAELTLPFMPARAREQFAVATGEILPALLDRLAPLPATETNPSPSWRRARLAAAETLVDAATCYGADAPVRADLRELSRGVHVVTTPDGPRPVVVEASRPLWREGDGWRESDLPTCPFGLVHHTTRDCAIPWYPQLGPGLLNTPPRYTLFECLSLLKGALKAAWRWQDAHAPLLVALWTAYAVVAYLWDRRVYLSVCGESNTGKTKVRDRLLRYFLPHGFPVVDATEYSLSVSYGNAAAPLFLDEAEGSDSRHLAAILTAARRATYEVAVKQRGTASGGVKETRFSWPLALFSTEPVGYTQADANRFLVVRTRPETGHMTETALPAFWRDNQVDPAELRADLWRHMLGNLPALAAAAETMRNTLPLPPGVDYRIAEPVQILLAAAEVAQAGDGARGFEHLAPMLQEQTAATVSLSPSEELIQAILYRPWRTTVEEADRERQVERNGAAVIHEAARGGDRVFGEDRYAVKGYSVVTRGTLTDKQVEQLDPPIAGPELWLNLAALRSPGGPLIGTTFEKLPGQRLAEMLARRDAHRGPTPDAWRRGGVKARWQRLDINTLLPDCEADDV